MTITRIGAVSIAKVLGVLYALIGVVIGAFFSLFAMAGAAASDSAGAAGWGAIMGVGAIVVIPILYGGLGFVMTLLSAWLFNLAAGWVGGVEIETH